MTDEPTNGRATVREVYQLVGEVDGKVDRILDEMGRHETRLAIIEKTCAERPDHCALEHAESRRTERTRYTDHKWGWVQRWGWVIVSAIASAGVIIGICNSGG